LITNLLSSFEPPATILPQGGLFQKNHHKRRFVLSSMVWTDEYAYGGMHQIFHAVFPPQFVGMTFGEAALYIYEELQIMLFALHKVPAVVKEKGGVMDFLFNPALWLQQGSIGSKDDEEDLGGSYGDDEFAKAAKAAIAEQDVAILNPGFNMVIQEKDVGCFLAFSQEEAELISTLQPHPKEQSRNDASTKMSFYVTMQKDLQKRRQSPQGGGIVYSAPAGPLSIPDKMTSKTRKFQSAANASLSAAAMQQAVLLTTSTARMGTNTGRASEHSSFLGSDPRNKPTSLFPNSSRESNVAPGSPLMVQRSKSYGGLLGGGNTSPRSLPSSLRPRVEHRGSILDALNTAKRLDQGHAMRGKLNSLSGISSADLKFLDNPKKKSGSLLIPAPQGSLGNSAEPNFGEAIRSQRQPRGTSLTLDLSVLSLPNEGGYSSPASPTSPNSPMEPATASSSAGNSPKKLPFPSSSGSISPTKLPYPYSPRDTPMALLLQGANGMSSLSIDIGDGTHPADTSHESNP
jgi:hypothetical protein